MIQSVNLPVHISSHPVHTAAHCNPLQPAANHPVHTLQQPLHLQCTLQPCTAMYSYLQPTFSAHCSQLQLSTTIYTAAIPSHPVHTAATPSGSNTIQCIQCTSGPPQGKPIPLLAYLQSSQQTLMVDCSSP